MEFKPREIPIWQNKGEAPDENLLINGYKNLDVPYARHLNYLFNRITTNLNYYMEGAVHSKDGVLANGFPVPLSDSGVDVSSNAPFKVLYNGNSWYNLTYPSGSEKFATLNLTYYGAYRNMNLGSASTSEYSVLIFVLEDVTNPLKITVTELDDVWGDVTVSKLKGELYGSTFVMTPVRVTMTSRVGAKTPTYANLSLKVTLEADTKLSNTTTFMRPLLFLGRSWSGNTNSLTSNELGAKDVFGYHAKSPINLMDITSSEKAPLGVSRLLTPSKGSYFGLPLNSDGILFNMARVGLKKGAQMVMLDNNDTKETEMYFRTHMNSKLDYTEFSKIATDRMVQAMLIGYATEDYVSTSLKKYITMEEAKRTFLNADNTVEWQKRKITKDDGSPLVVMSNNDSSTVLAGKLRDSLGGNPSAMISVSLPGALFWGSAITSGLPTVTSSNYLLSYLERGSGEAVYLSKSSHPLVGFLQGTTEQEAGGYIHLQGEVSSIVSGKTVSGKTFEGLPLTAKVRISINISDNSVSAIIWDSTDATAQVGAFNKASKDAHTKYLSDINSKNKGEIIYQGSSWSSITLLKPLSEFNRIVIEYRSMIPTYNPALVDYKTVEYNLVKARELKCHLEMSSHRYETDTWGKITRVYRELVLLGDDDLKWVGRYLYHRYGNASVVSPPDGGGGDPQIFITKVIGFK